MYSGKYVQIGKIQYYSEQLVYISILGVCLGGWEFVSQSLFSVIENLFVLRIKF